MPKAKGDKTDPRQSSIENMSFQHNSTHYEIKCYPPCYFLLALANLLSLNKILKSCCSFHLHLTTTYAIVAICLRQRASSWRKRSMETMIPWDLKSPETRNLRPALYESMAESSVPGKVVPSGSKQASLCAITGSAISAQNKSAKCEFCYATRTNIGLFRCFFPNCKVLSKTFLRSKAYHCAPKAN